MSKRFWYSAVALGALVLLQTRVAHAVGASHPADSNRHVVLAAAAVQTRAPVSSPCGQDGACSATTAQCIATAGCPGVLVAPPAASLPLLPSDVRVVPPARPAVPGRDPADLRTPPPRA